MTTPKQQSGFTLIELVVVMILIAMLASVVTYSVRGHIDAAKITRASETVRSLDRKIRQAARRNRAPISVNIHSSRRALTLESDLDLQPVGLKQRVQLPSSIRVEELLSSGDRSSVDKIQIRADGRSANYAIKLAHRGGANTWLVVLGISGQQISCRTEEQANALLHP